LTGYVLADVGHTINTTALGVTIGTIALLWVFRRFITHIPDTLGAMVAMTGIVWSTGIAVATIGQLPASIMLESHLRIDQIPWNAFNDIAGAAVSIASLAAIESLMTGTAGAAMSGKAFDADQELIAQGSANLIVPWFGGIPSSAAISRTAVAIRTGGETRLAGIFHALVLFVAVLGIAPIIAHVPLAALAGVLLWTAWHMCDWGTIRRYLQSGVRHAIVGMLVTMAATAALDLTQAILIGLAVSAIIHIRLEVQSAHVSVVPIDPTRLPHSSLRSACDGVRVAYISGSMFFGNAAAMRHALSREPSCHTLILSMRGVPMIDVMGAELLRGLIQEFRSRHGDVYIAGMQPAVQQMLLRLGVITLIGADHIYWDAATAIHRVHERLINDGCPHCGADCRAQFATTPPTASNDTKTPLLGE
jgi:SulP family sulfate permease